MQFELLGKQIEISDGRRNYMKILTDYRKLAEKAVAEFTEDYEKTFSLTFISSSYAEKFSRKYTGDALDEMVMPYVKETRRYLAAYGEYTLTDEMIWEQITSDYNGISGLRHRIEDFIVDNVSDDTTDQDIVPRIKAKFESGYFSRALRNDVMALCDFVKDYLDREIGQLAWYIDVFFRCGRLNTLAGRTGAATEQWCFFCFPGRQYRRFVIGWRFPFLKGNGHSWGRPVSSPPDHHSNLPGAVWLCLPSYRSLLHGRQRHTDRSRCIFLRQ